MPRSRPLPLILASLLTVIALAARATPARADLDVVFVLDTTGSMSGELGEAQERLRQLAAALRTARTGERVRFGVVAFRDRGDEYVTRTSPLSEEIATTEAFLGGLTADGGGDEPESVLAALDVALTTMEWDRAPATERRVVLVGDAPPHLDYADEQVIATARRDRIVIDTIGCRSLSPDGVRIFRRLAYATEGSYQHIGRVERPGTGERRAGLMAALGRVATASADRGVDVPLAPRGHDAQPSAVLLVRASDGVSTVGANGPAGCGLDVLLPPGLALAGAPIAHRLADRLVVRLPLTSGDGGRDRFTVSPCLPIGLPIQVEPTEEH